MSAIADQLQRLDEGIIFHAPDGKTFKVNVTLFVSADQKALLILFGLKSASSLYWCIWCNITKHDRNDVTNIYLDWHSHDHCRTVEHIEEHGQRIDDLRDDGSRGTKKQIQNITSGAGAGVTRFPAVLRRKLFGSFNRVIPDLLHLYLRTTERMLCDYYSLHTDAKARSELVERLEDHGVGIVAFSQTRTAGIAVWLAVSVISC